MYHLLQVASNQAKVLPTTRNTTWWLPVGDLIVLQKLTPLMLTSQEAGEDGVTDTGGGVDLVERRVEAQFIGFAASDIGGVLVGDPAGVDAVHVDSDAGVILSRRPRQHVESRLRHVRVRVPVRFIRAVEDALHRRHIDDVFVG